MASKAHKAYWIADGEHFTLFVGGHKRAEADVVFNSATLYSRPTMFGKPAEEFLVVDLSVVILAEIERKFGLGALPVMDTDGAPIDEARETMRKRARSFENFDRRPSDDPVGETIENIDLAHAALNRVAIDGMLCDRAAEARDLCARAARLLKERGRIAADVGAAISEAQTALDEAIGDRPVHRHFKLSEARFYIQRAAALAELYGAGRVMEPELVVQNESRGQQDEERAAKRRTSRAFARGF